ncbi:putative PLAC8 motif-containing protein [Helianthus annuus]|nr:putative PLAC8 motif-containing protein [Helianthus annuus]
MDRHEYTLDDEDRKVQEVIMNPDPFNTDVSVLRRSFSYSYPDLPFNEVIKKENEKLHFELQRSQSCLDASQSEIIQNFMEIAHVFASDHQCEDMPYYPYASRNQVHENSNDMQIVVHSASYSQDQNDYDMPYYSYVSSNQEHENSNGMQIIVHSDSNSQFERAIPYYPYVSSQQEDENRNDLQMIVHSASNTQFEKAIPYYPYVSSNQEHEKSNDAQIIVRSASNSKFAKAIPYYPDVSSKQERENSSDLQIGVRSALRSTSSTSSRQDLLSSRRIHRHEEWHSGPLGCCSEPMMCVKTLLFPCGTLSKIATAATNRHMSKILYLSIQFGTLDLHFSFEYNFNMVFNSLGSYVLMNKRPFIPETYTSADACNELLAYSLIASCCCYTCCIRMKLRNALNIRGGWCNDFLLHFCCCCCALVQELREIEIRGIHGTSYIVSRA